MQLDDWIVVSVMVLACTAAAIASLPRLRRALRSIGIWLALAFFAAAFVYMLASFDSDFWPSLLGAFGAGAIIQWLWHRRRAPRSA
ncbi:MAG: hypothetical protein ACREQ4_11550 [Candidatus Binataceae bacterium]